MALHQLKRVTVLLFLMAGAYVAVFIKNLNVFYIELLCIGLWTSGGKARESLHLLWAKLTGRKYYDGK